MAKKSAKPTPRKRKVKTTAIVDMNVSDLRAELKQCVADVQYNGKIIVIHHYGQPVAKVVPYD